MTNTKKPPYYSPLYHRATFLSNSWVCTQLVRKWGVSLLSRGKTVWRTCVNRPNLERIFSSWRPQPSLTKHHQTSGLRYGASQNGHSFTKFFQLTGVFVGWGLDSGLSGTSEMYNLHTELNWVTTRKFTFQLSFYLIETFHWENKIYQQVQTQNFHYVGACPPILCEPEVGQSRDKGFLTRWTESQAISDHHTE